MIPPVLMALVLMALPVTAQTPLTADEFDAYTRGKTLFYSFDGVLQL